MQMNNLSRASVVQVEHVAQSGSRIMGDDHVLFEERHGRAIRGRYTV